MNAKTATFMEKAAEAWGDAMPEWVVTLATACDAQGQRRVADIIERSPALVSNVIRGRYGANGYAGDLTAVEQVVRGALMNATLNCPVLGEIGLNRCQDERTRPFTATSSMRARLYRACRQCPHNQNAGG
ncbi:hypothetical protein [Rhodospirillum centenum]|uniref:Transcriptional regulator n=1 Tax=Rhodospirillum centenum (strain ATCC 51521 / SW) TaxID=414684 RepID=B6ISS5_RHOCS|nr:hypothetical protein [Rhodospirillum centenum]ACI98511.1 phage-related conserved hypothetical protein [Rhodospirillum centenum SW]